MYWQGVSIGAKLMSPAAKWIAALVVILGLVFAGLYLHRTGYEKGYKTAETEGQLELAQFKEKIRTLLEEQMKNQREYELAVENRVAQIQKDKENEVKALSDRYNNLVISLRNRPTRAVPSPSPDKNPAPSTTDSGGARCTGRELSREDGEFLAREAYRADILRKALEACRNSYDGLISTQNRKTQ